MDPAQITLTAASALALLQPYLPVLAQKAAEKIGESLPSAVASLWKKIQPKMQGKEAAQEALVDLLAKPESEAFQTVFKVQLEKLLAQDQEFLAAVRGSVVDAEKAGFSIRIGSRGVSLGEHARDNIVVTGDNSRVVKGKPDKDE